MGNFIYLPTMVTAFTNRKYLSLPSYASCNVINHRRLCARRESLEITTRKNLRIILGIAGVAFCAPDRGLRRHLVIAGWEQKA